MQREFSDCNCDVVCVGRSGSGSDRIYAQVTELNLNSIRALHELLIGEETPEGSLVIFRNSVKLQHLASMWAAVRAADHDLSRELDWFLHGFICHCHPAIGEDGSPMADVYSYDPDTPNNELCVTCYHPRVVTVPPSAEEMRRHCSSQGGNGCDAGSSSVSGGGSAVDASCDSDMPQLFKEYRARSLKLKPLDGLCAMEHSCRQQTLGDWGLLKFEEGGLHCLAITRVGSPVDRRMTSPLAEYVRALWGTEKFGIIVPFEVKISLERAKFWFIGMRNYLASKFIDEAINKLKPELMAELYAEPCEILNENDNIVRQQLVPRLVSEFTDESICMLKAYLGDIVMHAFASGEYGGMPHGKPVAKAVARLEDEFEDRRKAEPSYEREAETRDKLIAKRKDELALEFNLGPDCVSADSYPPGYFEFSYEQKVECTARLAKEKFKTKIEAKIEAEFGPEPREKLEAVFTEKLEAMLIEKLEVIFAEESVMVPQYYEYAILAHWFTRFAEMDSVRFGRWYYCGPADVNFRKIFSAPCQYHCLVGDNDYDSYIRNIFNPCSDEAILADEFPLDCRERLDEFFNSAKILTAKERDEIEDGIFDKRWTYGELREACASDHKWLRLTAPIAKFSCTYGFDEFCRHLRDLLELDDVKTPIIYQGKLRSLSKSLAANTLKLNDLRTCQYPWIADFIVSGIFDRNSTWEELEDQLAKLDKIRSRIHGAVVKYNAECDSGFDPMTSRSVIHFKHVSGGKVSVDRKSLGASDVRHDEPSIDEFSVEDICGMELPVALRRDLEVAIKDGGTVYGGELFALLTDAYGAFLAKSSNARRLECSAVEQPKPSAVVQAQSSAVAPKHRCWNIATYEDENWSIGVGKVGEFYCIHVHNVGLPTLASMGKIRDIFKSVRAEEGECCIFLDGGREAVRRMWMDWIGIYSILECDYTSGVELARDYVREFLGRIGDRAIKFNGCFTDDCAVFTFNADAQASTIYNSSEFDFYVSPSSGELDPDTSQPIEHPWCHLGPEYSCAARAYLDFVSVGESANGVNIDCMSVHEHAMLLCATCAASFADIAECITRDKVLRVAAEKAGKAVAASSGEITEVNIKQVYAQLARLLFAVVLDGGNVDSEDPCNVSARMQSGIMGMLADNVDVESLPRLKFGGGLPNDFPITIVDRHFGNRDGVPLIQLFGAGNCMLGLDCLLLELSDLLSSQEVDALRDGIMNHAWTCSEVRGCLLRPLAKCCIELSETVGSRPEFPWKATVPPPPEHMPIPVSRYSAVPQITKTDGTVYLLDGDEIVAHKDGAIIMCAVENSETLFSSIATAMAIGGFVPQRFGSAKNGTSFQIILDIIRYMYLQNVRALTAEDWALRIINPLLRIAYDWQEQFGMTCVDTEFVDHVLPWCYCRNVGRDHISIGDDKDIKELGEFIKQKDVRKTIDDRLPENPLLKKDNTFTFVDVFRMVSRQVQLVAAAYVRHILGSYHFNRDVKVDHVFSSLSTDVPPYRHVVCKQYLPGEAETAIPNEKWDTSDEKFTTFSEYQHKHTAEQGHCGEFYEVAFAAIAFGIPIAIERGGNNPAYVYETDGLCATCEYDRLQKSDDMLTLRVRLMNVGGDKTATSWSAIVRALPLRVEGTWMDAEFLKKEVEAENRESDRRYAEDMDKAERAYEAKMKTYREWFDSKYKLSGGELKQIICMLNSGDVKPAADKPATPSAAAASLDAARKAFAIAKQGRRPLFTHRVSIVSEQAPQLDPEQVPPPDPAQVPPSTPEQAPQLDPEQAPPPAPVQAPPPAPVQAPPPATVQAPQPAAVKAPPPAS
ncbi:MAG: hypothetical protein LBB38_00845, partial [Puniceicoccales bacterium]|nr:hypothetical protein [Puniceicoccales bacterium]